jgi:hypothetical protein
VKLHGDFANKNNFDVFLWEPKNMVGGVTGTTAMSLGLAHKSLYSVPNWPGADPEI